MRSQINTSVIWPNEFYWELKQHYLPLLRSSRVHTNMVWSGLPLSQDNARAISSTVNSCEQGETCPARNWDLLKCKSTRGMLAPVRGGRSCHVLSLDPAACDPSGRRFSKARESASKASTTCGVRRSVWATLRRRRPPAIQAGG